MLIFSIFKTLFIITSFYKYIFVSSQDKSEKQLKYDACYRLVQSRVEQEKSHFRELSSELKPEEVNNILQYSLFECYQNIDYYDAEYIDEKKSNIDIYDEKYIDLLNFEKWENLISKKDEKEIQNHVMNLQNAYRDIQSGEIVINKYNKKSNTQNKKNYGDNYNNNHKQNENNNEQVYIPNENEFELFGINFTNLSPTIKNIIGFGLIILVFCCVVYGLKWIQSIREGNNSNNKKKKNKKDKKKQK